MASNTCRFKRVSYNHPLVWLLSKLERIGYHYSDEIVGTMPGLAEHVQKVLGTPKKVTFIPQGVDLTTYTQQKNVSNEYLSAYVPRDKFVVTYTGTFGNANAMEFIVDSARHLDDGKNNILFLLVGDGVLKNDLMQRAKGLSNITFAPAVAKDEVLHILSLSDVLIASVRNQSIYRYGISLNKFIDYMYARKPVVCMFSGYQSMLNEARCGIFTPAEDSISFAEAITYFQRMDKNSRDAVGMRGYNFLVNNRNFEILAKTFVELFNEKKF